MISNPVGIQSATSVGGGQYTITLFFQNTNLAKYLNVGDQITDTASNTYEIITIASAPFVSGGSLTISFVTTDTLPINDSGFDSVVFTPGQVDVRPEVRTAVFLTGSAIFDSQNYEYTIQGNVADLLEADQAVVGDSIVDLQGKEYTITFIDPVFRFTSPFRVTETAREGASPLLGDASLYRATTNNGLFQGTEIADPARTVVRNRDNFLLDQKIKELESQISGSNAGISSNIANNTGSTIIKATPVRLNNFGDIETIDVAVEDEALATIGITSEDINDGASGTIVTAGKVVDITTTAIFDDLMFVSKSGTLTNVKPDIGVSGFVAGDFVVSVGVIAKNESNPANKDLIVNVQIVGQL